MIPVTKVADVSVPTLEEVWKEVPLDFSYPYRLAVSTFGKAKLFKADISESGKSLKPSYEDDRVSLVIYEYFKNDNGKQTKRKHRFSFALLIAKTFIPNPEDFKFINHKDGDKKNNAVSNLEWSKFRLSGTKKVKDANNGKLYRIEKTAVFFEDEAGKRKYAITDFGRVVLFYKEVSDGRFIVPYLDNKGRPMITITPLGDKRKTWLVHKLVATYFLPKPKEGQQFVIHKDYDKTNNHYDNLAWASQAEKTKHSVSSPKMMAINGVNRQKGLKLTRTQVIHIKRLLQKGKTRNKMIAKQFGISEMALYRIKRGENWGHVTTENV